MFIFDRQRLDGLLADFASGFTASPVALIASAALVLAIIAFLILSHAVITKRERRRIAAAVKRKCDLAFARLSLTPEETAFVHGLAGFLKDPTKEYLVLSSQGTFATCLQRYREGNEVPRELLRGLQEKTGFDPRKVPRIRSSRDLPEGMPVVLETSGAGGGRRTQGVIQIQEGRGFSVKLKGAGFPSSRGTPVTVYCHDPSGVFAFASSVQSLDGSTILLGHTDRLKTSQRRKYFRHRMGIPVFVRPDTGVEKPAGSTLLDLGGGGASLRNPGSRYADGDDIRIYFRQDEKTWLPVEATVVRTSKHGAILHVQFGHVTEAVRDRIIRMAKSGP